MQRAQALEMRQQLRAVQPGGLALQYAGGKPVQPGRRRVPQLGRRPWKIFLEFQELV
jgi:hypothetical protein